MSFRSAFGRCGASRRAGGCGAGGGGGSGKWSRSAAGGRHVADESAWRADQDTKTANHRGFVRGQLFWLNVKGAVLGASAVASLGAAAYAYFAHVRPMLKEWRDRPFDFSQLEVGPHTYNAEAMPAFMVPEKKAAAEGRRLEHFLVELLKNSEDEQDGVPAVRRTVTVGGQTFVDELTARSWALSDPHAYSLDAKHVANLQPQAAGHGAEIKPDDVVHLFFYEPSHPNRVFRETVRLNRDQLCGPLRSAVLSAKSGAEFAFDYDGGGNQDAAGKRVVRVKAHSEVVDELASDAKKMEQLDKVLEGTRRRAF